MFDTVKRIFFGKYPSLVDEIQRQITETEFKLLELEDAKEWAESNNLYYVKKLQRLTSLKDSYTKTKSMSVGT